MVRNWNALCYTYSHILQISKYKPIHIFVCKKRHPIHILIWGFRDYSYISCSFMGDQERNLYQCPQDVKEAAYRGLFRPVLEYDSCVWDPQCVVLQQEIEVQSRAARFVTINNCIDWNWAPWLSGRASALWPVGCGFDPRPGHTKDFKNGTSCSFAWRSALRK